MSSWQKSILLLAVFSATLPVAHAQDPIFDLNPALELAGTRLELALNAPPNYRKAVKEELLNIQRGWSASAMECADQRKTPIHLVNTKAYLQSILLRLTTSSNISQGLLNTNHGVCVTPVEQPQGLFANLLRGPRLNRGQIQVPPKFLLELQEEDELAFVLAHELSHFLLKHEIMLAYMLATKRSSDGIAVASEREADELAMRLIINAGYDLDKALMHLKELRTGDSHYFDGSQLQDLRNIVMVDLAKTKRTYQPAPSASYLPRAVMSEIQVYLKQIAAL